MVFGLPDLLGLQAVSFVGAVDLRCHSVLLTPEHLSVAYAAVKIKQLNCNFLLLF